LISVIQLGTVDYSTGLALQQQLVALRKEEKIGDVLLLLEHKPVITLGRNAKAANVIASAELLAQRGVELFECDRGGDVTFHGPGQIVGYPIFDLRSYASGAAKDYGAADAPIRRACATIAERKHLGAVDFVRRLEGVLIRTCADFAIPTKRIPGLTGVWTDPAVRSGSQAMSSRAERDDSKNRHAQSRDPELAVAPESKLAAIGVHISRAVTSHGFALNVSTGLSFFNLIVPCGIAAKPVTSMQQQLSKVLDLNAVTQSISRNFGVVFQSQILLLETLDALLGRVVGVPVQPTKELRQLRKEDETTRA